MTPLKNAKLLACPHSILLIILKAQLKTWRLGTAAGYFRCRCTLVLQHMPAFYPEDREHELLRAWILHLRTLKILIKQCGLWSKMVKVPGIKLYFMPHANVFNPRIHAFNQTNKMWYTSLCGKKIIIMYIKISRKSEGLAVDAHAHTHYTAEGLHQWRGMTIPASGFIWSWTTALSLIPEMLVWTHSNPLIYVSQTLNSARPGCICGCV